MLNVVLVQLVPLFDMCFILYIRAFLSVFVSSIRELRESVNGSLQFCGLGGPRCPLCNSSASKFHLLEGKQTAV